MRAIADACLSAWAGVWAGVFVSSVARVAIAQEAAPEFVAPTADQFLLDGSLAALFILIAVRFLRAAFPETLAPRPATPRSRRFTMLATLACGLGFAALGLAPAVAPGFTGQVLGGVGTAGIAYFGAGLLGSRLRGEKKSAPKDGE